MNRSGGDEFQFIHWQIASVSKIDFSSGNWISVMVASLSVERKWSSPQPSPVNEQNTPLRMIRLGFRVLTSRKYSRATTARIECTPAGLKAIVSKIFVERCGTRALFVISFLFFFFSLYELFRNSSMNRSLS